MSEKVVVVKIGGQVIDDEASLEQFVQSLAKVEEPLVIVHGGGKIATEIAQKLSLPVVIKDGRRITDLANLKVVQAVYGGLINKSIVARLQKHKKNAIGLCGVDGNLIEAKKRPLINDIDYGFVGDVTKVNTSVITGLLRQNMVPVIAPLTHDGLGTILNTNADTVATEVAIALAKVSKVELFLCFELKGVLKDAQNNASLIHSLSSKDYEILSSQKIFSGGMLPKLENGFKALKEGVFSVRVCHWQDVSEINNAQEELGTQLVLA